MLIQDEATEQQNKIAMQQLLTSSKIKRQQNTTTTTNELQTHMPTITTNKLTMSTPSPTTTRNIALNIVPVTIIEICAGIGTALITLQQFQILMYHSHNIDLRIQLIIKYEIDATSNDIYITVQKTIENGQL